MALFKRRKKQPEESEPQVPAEIQEYYQAERRERAGVAWLLALGTLLATVLLAVGLFFGGRWIYRKVTHKNTPVATTSQPSNQTSTTPSTSSSGAGSSSGSSSSQSSPSTSSQSTTSGSSSTSSSSGSTPPSSSSTSQTTQNTKIPNTGPGDMAAVFVVVSLITALAHSQVTRYKTNK